LVLGHRDKLIILTPDSIEEFMDYQLGGSLEDAEMNPERQAKFGRECTAKFKRFLNENGLVDSGDVVFFSGYK
jgi:hypothetical protein